MNNEYPQSLSILFFQFLYYILLWIDILSKIIACAFLVLPVFWAKADAKVLQIFDMTKYFSKKNA